MILSRHLILDQSHDSGHRFSEMLDVECQQAIPSIPLMSTGGRVDRTSNIQYQISGWAVGRANYGRILFLWCGKLSGFFPDPPRTTSSALPWFTIRGFVYGLRSMSAPC